MPNSTCSFDSLEDALMYMSDNQIFSPRYLVMYETSGMEVEEPVLFV